MTYLSAVNTCSVNTGLPDLDCSDYVTEVIVAAIVDTLQRNLTRLKSFAISEQTSPECSQPRHGYLGSNLLARRAMTRPPLKLRLALKDFPLNKTFKNDSVVSKQLISLQRHIKYYT